MQKIASLAEQGVCWALVGVFLVFQLSATVWLVSDFNWLTFIDFDDAADVEQFLGNIHDDSVEGLPGWNVAYGSKLFLVIPVYKLVALVLGGSSALDAYRFLKVFHIVAAGLALLLLRVVMRQSGVPVFAPVLVIALVVSSPLFFALGHHFKADANVVLFLLTAGLWTLLKFDGSGRRGWLIASILLGGLAAAVKYWGVFLIVPQVYLMAVRYSSGERFKPEISWRAVFTANTISCVLLFLTLLVQGKPLLQQYSYKLVVLAAIGSTGLLLFLSLSVVTVGCWLLLRQISANPAGFASLGVRLSRLSYCLLSVCSLFVASYLVFASPFLLSNQLRPSMSFRSQSLVVGPYTDSGYAILPVVSRLMANIAEWLLTLIQSGALPLLLVPGLVCSAILLFGGLKNQRRLRAIAMFPAALLVFLLLVVTKKSDSTVAMLLAFVAILSVGPVAIWALQMRALWQRVVLTVLVLVVVGQTVLQLQRTVDVISSYPKAIQAISMVNQRLMASINGVSGIGQTPTIFVPGREFPIKSAASGIKYLTGSDYGGLLTGLLNSCNDRRIGGRAAQRDSSAFLVVKTDRGSAFASYLQRVGRLRDTGCLDLISEIVGETYSRGGRWRFSFGVYQLPKL